MKRRAFLAAAFIGIPDYPRVFGDKYRPVPLGLKQKVEAVEEATVEPFKEVPKEITEAPAEVVEQSARKFFEVGDFRLRVFTQKGCIPCENWKVEETKWLFCGIEYVRIEDFPDIGGAPYFRLHVRYPLGADKFVPIQRGKHSGNDVYTDDRYIAWRGYTTYPKINDEIKRQIRILSKDPNAPVPKDNHSNDPNIKVIVEPSVAKSSNVNRRWTAAELKKWAYENYLGVGKNPEHHATVSPRSGVWNHLCGSKHGFARNQVQSLTMSEAMAVHAGRHRGTIHPYTAGKFPSSTQRVSSSRKVQRY